MSDDKPAADPKYLEEIKKKLEEALSGKNFGGQVQVIGLDDRLQEELQQPILTPEQLYEQWNKANPDIYRIAMTTRDIDMVLERLSTQDIMLMMPKNDGLPSYMKEKPGALVSFFQEAVTYQAQKKGLINPLAGLAGLI